MDRFNVTCRYGCPNQDGFLSLAGARQEIDQRGAHHNDVRPTACWAICYSLPMPSGVQ
ncbi:hypothetical protein [Halomonas sp. I5-271120]|uniref:hypothetical protein n=1 Tax=Halomonas sp. I5-271120 TaxID=3061632 RepID=UPI00350E5383